MYKAILFDADGMIIVAKRFSDQLQEQYGISWQKMEPFFKGRFQDCKLGKADLKEELSNVIQDWGWTKSVDELVDFWLACGTELNQAMVTRIHELRKAGILCCLTTNQEKYRAEFLHTELNFDELFEAIFVSAELGYMKNDPAFFSRVYTFLQDKQPDLNRSEVLFCDDHAENIEAANAFGFRTHEYHDKQGLEQALLEI